MSLSKGSIGSITRRVPVLIVGGGPCGMLASILLSKYRIPSLLVEKQGREPSSHPRAHVLNTRSMEILRKIGLEDEIAKLAPPREDWVHFRYCDHLSQDTDFAMIDHTKTKEYRQLMSNSPSRVTQISQPILESCLRDKALATIKSTKDSEILFNHEVTDVDFATKTVLVAPTASSPSSSSSNPIRVQPDLIIATDGAKSIIRDLSSIRMNGKTFLESFVSVHFTSEDLGKRLRKSRKTSMLTFVFNPDVIAAVVVAHDARGKGNFVCHLPFFPPSETWTDYESREKIAPLLDSLMGNKSAAPGSSSKIKFQIESIKSWGMHATLADRLVTKDHWIAFAGDAAHQFPPSGGFGVNVGMSEIDNLAFKLFKASSSSEDRKLVDSPKLKQAVGKYQSERFPIANETLKVALDNYNRGLEPARALGLDRNSASALSQVSQYVPSIRQSMMRSLAKIPVQYAIMQKDRVEKLRKVVEVDRAALPLFFPQVDLGVDYAKGKLDSDATRMSEHHVGRLVKHCWLFSSTLNKMVSTRDLANPFFFGNDSSSLIIDETIFVRAKDVDDLVAEMSAIKYDLTQSRVVIVQSEKDGSVAPMTNMTKGLLHQQVMVTDKLSTSFFQHDHNDSKDQGGTTGNNDDGNILAVVVRGDGFVSRLVYSSVVKAR